MAIEIAQGIIDTFPQYKVGLFYFRQDELRSDASSVSLAIMSEVLESMGFLYVKGEDHPHMQLWIEAYCRMGVRRSDARRDQANGCLRLLNRVLKLGATSFLATMATKATDYFVHPLTNIYNSMSLKYVAPVGGDDFRMFSGNPTLTINTANREMEDISGRLISVPEGRIVWQDDLGITCANWNSSQCRRTAITDGTREFLFTFDSLEESLNLVDVLEDFQQTIQRAAVGSSCFAVLGEGNMTWNVPARPTSS